MNNLKKIAYSVGTAAVSSLVLAQGALAQNIEIKPGAGFENLANPPSLSKIVSTILQVLLIFASVVFFVMLLTGGIRWILSGGDKTNTQNARSQITAALIGLVVVFSAWIIAGLVGQVFKVNLFNLQLPTL